MSDCGVQAVASIDVAWQVQEVQRVLSSKPADS